MLSEPRTISLLCELVHIPMKHLPEGLREVYNRVCSSCGYENFIRTPGGARIERQQEAGGFSHVSFTGDRIQLTEDHVGISVEQFARKVAAVLTESVQVLRIPIVLLQQTTVRVIAMPNSFRSAADFLSQRIFRVPAGDLEAFGRPSNLFGFRMSLPPTRDDPTSFNIRVETYLRDRRSLYIENVGTFKAPVQASSLEVVERQTLATSELLTDRVIPFLSRYDTRGPETP